VPSFENTRSLLRFGPAPHCRPGRRPKAVARGMGNAGSAHAQASLRVVAAVSSTAPLPLDAAEWQQLLSYATPLSRFDPGEVEREIRPHCAELGAHGLPGRGCGRGALAAAACSLQVPPLFERRPHCMLTILCCLPCSVQQLPDAQPAALHCSGGPAAEESTAAGGCSPCVPLPTDSRACPTKPCIPVSLLPSVQFSTSNLDCPLLLIWCCRGEAVQRWAMQCTACVPSLKTSWSS
jgi:hypothetical protein